MLYVGQAAHVIQWVYVIQCAVLLKSEAKSMIS